MVATCCNSAMFLDFTKGHWLTLYRDRLPEPLPPLEMRVMTADRREGVVLPQDVPNYATHSGKFMWKLLAAWAAMGFRCRRLGACRRKGVGWETRPRHLEFCGYSQCLGPLEMSRMAPDRNVSRRRLGSGGGRARSPSVAQRPTAGRCMGRAVASLFFRVRR